MRPKPQIATEHENGRGISYRLTIHKYCRATGVLGTHIPKVQGVAVAGLLYTHAVRSTSRQQLQHLDQQQQGLLV